MSFDFQNNIPDNPVSDCIASATSDTGLFYSLLLEILPEENRPDFIWNNDGFKCNLFANYDNYSIAVIYNSLSQLFRKYPELCKAVQHKVILYERTIDKQYQVGIRIEDFQNNIFDSKSSHDIKAYFDYAEFLYYTGHGPILLYKKNSEHQINLDKENLMQWIIGAENLEYVMQGDDPETSSYFNFLQIEISYELVQCIIDEAYKIFKPKASVKEIMEYQILGSLCNCHNWRNIVGSIALSNNI